MRNRFFLALGTLLATTTLAQAAVLDFENFDVVNDISTWGGSSLDGFSMVGIDNATYTSSTFSEDFPLVSPILPGGAFSGTQVAYNFNDRIGALVRDAGTMQVNSVWAHGDARDPSAEVLFQGLDALGGNVLFSKTVILTAEWTQITFDGWVGVKAFVWDAIDPNASNVALDDFTYDELAPVPLPAGLPLLLAGLGSLAVLRRKRG